jgi:hypothetical protein
VSEYPGHLHYEPDLHQVVDLGAGETGPLPRIYAFVNGGSPGWYLVSALTEDGEFIAGHACSHPSFGPHDMGVTSDWKHDHYRERYPGGYVVVWVEGGPKDDERVMAAHRRHVEAGENGTPWQQSREAARREVAP